MAARPDHAPTPPAKVPALEKGDFVWGGYAQPQFGHLVAEHLTRLPVSLHHRPNDTYLFTRHPRRRMGAVPDFFYTLCEWYGLKRAQIRILDKPMRAETLRVAPQAEQLYNADPAPYALEMIQAIADRNGVVPEPSNVLYVTRDGFVAKGKGGLAGEGYLVSKLKAAGVAILDPATRDLRRAALGLCRGASPCLRRRLGAAWAAASGAPSANHQRAEPSLRVDRCKAHADAPLRQA